MARAVSGTTRSGLTASVAVLRPMIAFARTRGVRVDALLGEVGLTQSMLDDFDRRIPEAVRARLWTLAAAQSGDPTFGLHVAEHAQIGAYDVLDYALYFSSRLDDALDRIVRFHRVLCDAWAPRLEVDGGVARIRALVWTPPPAIEGAFAFLVLRAQALTGTGPRLREVRFTHASPRDTVPYEALFGCPVRFGRPTSELIVAVKDLVVPIPSANPGVLRILDRYMSEMLERHPRSESFVDRVRAAVARTIPAGRPTLQTIAADLHVAPRTVQRKLLEHGSSYGEVVDAVRREAAEALVSEGKLSVTEIAFLVGFADVSGFRRIYKRWTGTAPSRGRRRS